MLNDSERRELELLRKQSQVQTVEQTSKTWKLLQLLGAIATLVGIFLGFASLKLNPPYAALFLAIGAAGFALYLVGKIGAWWYHA